MSDLNSNKKISSISKLLKCRDLQNILDAGRTMINNPLILTDLTHKVLAITNEAHLTDPNWLNIKNQGGVPLIWADHASISDCYLRSKSENRPVLDSAPKGYLSFLRKSLTVQDKLVGYLDSPCYSGSFSEEECDIFDLIGDLCAICMQRDLGYVDSSENLLEFFIADLITGRISDEHLIEERFRYFHWNFKGSLCILTAHLDTPDATNSIKRLKNLQQRLSASYPTFTLFVYGSDIKIIVPATRHTAVESDSMARLKEQLLLEGLSAGVSRPFTNKRDFAYFNRQAEKALQLGKLLHPEKNLYYYDSYAVFHSLEICGTTTDLLQFCHSAIFILAEYDREHETDMLESLQAYLVYHKNVAKAASVLYIHRNTMNYRISKINDLLGIDLGNTEVTFHLLYSFHILEYYSAAVMRDSEEQRRRKPRLN